MVDLTATPDLDSASVALLVETGGVAAVWSRSYLGLPPSGAEIAEWAAQGGATVWGDTSRLSFTGSAANQGGRIAVSGLTPGVTYRVRAQLVRSDGVTTGKFGVGTYATVTPPVGVTGSSFETTFVAAGATADLDVLIASASGVGTLSVNQLWVFPDGSELADWSLVSLTRTDVNGTRSVRLPEEGADLGSGAFLVTDSEAALTGLVRYDVRIYDDLNETDASATTTTTLDGVTRPHLAPVVLPTLGRELRLVLADGHAEQHASSSTVHEVIGRADPLVTIGPLRTRAGQYRVWCEDYATAQDVVALAARGDVLLIRYPDLPGADMYHLVDQGGVRVEYLATVADVGGQAQRWAVTVSYVEVTAPTGPLLGQAGWTYAASTARNATYGDSSAEFATYLDLLIGPVS